MAVQGYLRRVNDAWNDYDGYALATLVSFHDSHARNPKLQV
jgi:hypothetical protein